CFTGSASARPILRLRSAPLGVAASLNLAGNRFNLGHHVDLDEVFNFHGSWREHYKLDYWCRRFDVESPKGSIDGSQIGRAYRDGRIDDIGEYCLRDVRATAELFTKGKDTLLPLFQG